jgi:HEAT repeat protein
LFGPEIEAELLAVMKSLAMGLEDREVRADDREQIMQKCAEILARIGAPSCARELLKLLKLPLSIYAKRDICYAIAAAGDDATRNALRKLVLEPKSDPKLSNFAALALIRVGDEELLPKLLEVSSEERSPEPLRAAACEACRECWSDRVPRFLADRLLLDPAPKVKLAAARSLAYLGGPLAVDTLKRAFRLDLDAETHFECSRGLASLGDAEAEDLLIESLKNKINAPNVRVVAAKALSQLDRPKARDALVSVLHDPTELEPIRQRCLDALQTIQREQGWRLLLTGGWEAP